MKNLILFAMILSLLLNNMSLAKSHSLNVLFDEEIKDHKKTEVELFLKKKNGLRLSKKTCFEFMEAGTTYCGFADNGINNYGVVLVFQDDSFKFAVNYGTYSKIPLKTMPNFQRNELMFSHVMQACRLSTQNVYDLGTIKQTDKQSMEGFALLAVAIPIGILTFPIVAYNAVNSYFIQNRYENVYDALVVGGKYEPQSKLLKSQKIDYQDNVYVVSIEGSTKIIFGVTSGNVSWKFREQYFPWVINQVSRL